MSQLSCKEFDEKLQQEGSVLIDVRTAEELDMFGIIQEQQTHINMYERDAAERLLALDKRKIYLIYCWHGNRSTSVCQFMLSHGFQNVWDLAGGIEAWKNYKKS